MSADLTFGRDDRTVLSTNLYTYNSGNPIK